MLWRRRATSEALSFGVEQIPGIGAVSGLGSAARWHLAGEYAAKHRLVGPWYRKICLTCGTRGGCEYRRWADDILITEVRREWLGQ